MLELALIAVSQTADLELSIAAPAPPWEVQEDTRGRPKSQEPERIWFSASYLYPVQIDGRAVNMSGPSDMPFSLGQDLGITGRSAAGMGAHGDIDSNGTWMMEITAVWFGGRGTLARAQNYGGDSYGAGQVIQTTGYGLWIDISTPLTIPSGDKDLQLYLGPSISIFTAEILQDRDSLHVIYAFEGFRAAARYKPTRGLTFGLDLTGLVGGRGDAIGRVDDALTPLGFLGPLAAPVAVLLPLLAAFSEPSFAWTAHVWVSVAIAPSVALVGGYYHRGVLGSNIRSDFGGQGLDLYYGGPMVALEVRY